MAQDSEKRFHSIMDKLFHAPKSGFHSPTYSTSGELLSGSKKRSYESTALGAWESNMKGDVAEGQHPSLAAAGATRCSCCRPWDRGDFIKRLATFKSISWFAKPKVVSAVNCARRGWISVDIDTIACEACGARLLFHTPASWNQQQVEKAALVFSLKLDSGHKLLCPWRGNICDEILTRFPPTPPQVLVNNYRERCSALLQLSALPQISQSAVDFMKSPLLEDFLGDSSMLESGNGSASNSEIENLSSQRELKLYYLAQKLISLCGWTLRSLPYQVDCKDVADRSIKNIVTDNNNLIVHSANADESLETDANSNGSIGEQMNPNSVVLDCCLCGATVGLWAFCTIHRPVELFRLVGHAEIVGNDIGNSSSKHDKHDLGTRQGVTSTLSDVATSFQYSSNLNMTIAGGPSPTKQNFKATVSFPVIGQNLRARLSDDSDFSDHASVDGDSIQSDSQKRIRLQEKTDCTVDSSTRQLVPLSSETMEISKLETASQTSISNSNGDDAIVGTQNEGLSSSSKDMVPIHLESDGLNSSAAVGPNSSQIPAIQLGNLENYRVRSGVENPVNCKDVTCNSGKDMRPSDRALEFDPIRQHRHFCPWIASMNDEEPGWKQTLSALLRQKDHSNSSPLRSLSSTSIIKVEDPIGSVKKLFMSPSMRRTKQTRISGHDTGQR
ncbi:uncharacterized protein LOC129320830 isoform X2 [Prosopis cineraria]|uniref:uncharacterized protein LOC129320830 isoform X2 n=1 Tax=Prosopis cineraria TaxID=364024 RepID=UPI0024104724|nr:uncharacterized protein LOC129320830 isoform X2 [Prosopis cineraria]